MISLYRGWPDRRRKTPGDLRVRMISETQAFLNWALTQGDAVPRIPRRRASREGFSPWAGRLGTGETVHDWWDRTLSHFGR